MAADNVKTAFRPPSVVNEAVIRYLIWLHHQKQQHQKIINQQQQKMLPNIQGQIYTGKDLC